MEFSQLPLKDMQVPEAIGWWPPAPGWWLLFLLCLSGLVVLRFYIRNKLNDPRRYALAELNRIENDYREHQDALALVRQCNTLLKRTALSLYPRSKVAGLSGRAWLDFLQQSGGLTETGPLELLESAPYQPDPQIDVSQLLQRCRHWLKQAGELADV